MLLVRAVHQPNSEVFHTFSKVMLLYKYARRAARSHAQKTSLSAADVSLDRTAMDRGKCLYFGSINELSSGLRASGVGCPAEHNLADHAIDLIQTTSEEQLDSLGVALAKRSPPQRSKGDSVNERSWAAAMATPVAAGFSAQLLQLSKREALYIWRNKPALIASIVAPAALNLLFAGIFAHTGDATNERTKASCDTGEQVGYTTQAHFGSVAQVLIGGMFGAAQPLLLRFPLDRGIFLRE